MRRHLMLAVAAAAALLLAAVAIANAASFTVKVEHVIMTFGGNTSPKKLPKDEYAPVTTTFYGKIKTDNGTHPPALREVIFDIDKDVKINVKGFPSCKPGELEARDTKAAMKVCGDAVIGEGIAHIEVAFPEQKPLLVTSPITVFSGGEKGGKVKLLIHVFITVPAPAAIVTDVTISRKGSGLHSVSRIPVAAGGSGSAIDFEFKLGKTYSYKGKRVGYFEAKCPDGLFRASVPELLFRNEAQIPGIKAVTTLSGSAAVPCTPKG